MLGHEIAGTVVSPDPTGAGPPAGTRVAILPARRCGTCPACRSGAGNRCPQQATTSIGLGLRDGGYAEQVAVPASACHPLPAGTTADRGALAEPYAVALHAVGRSRAVHDPDVAVLVIGAGSVGLMCAAALRRAGVARVAVAEPRPARAAVAASLGAAAADDAAAGARALGRAPDVVFEAAGTPHSPGLAVETAAAGGQVVLLGAAAPGETVALPELLWLVKRSTCARRSPTRTPSSRLRSTRWRAARSTRWWRRSTTGRSTGRGRPSSSSSGPTGRSKWS
ncbi:MAG: alcohol dehydrogenase catalytic domain-containing protein [Acidimicrobiia bacterium]